MNRPLRILAVSVVGLIAGCASRHNENEGPYIGTWYAQGRNPSLTWKLAPDGTYGQGQGFVSPATDDGTWSVKDGQLILKKNGDGQQQLKANVVGNTLTVDDPDGPLIFTRVAK